LFKSIPTHQEVKMPSTWSQDKYIKASFFAAEALNEQIFPGTNLPFMIHLGLVSMEVIAALEAESGLDGDLAVQCALLHDVIDYSNQTNETIGREFGIEVAQGVQALSRLEGVPESQILTVSLARVQKQPREVWMVKMADKLTNLASPPGSWTSKTLETYRTGALQTYETLKPASQFLADRLLKKIKTAEKKSDH
jgi:(p)ppGpp synthase/HD superfamily hydrolase